MLLLQINLHLRDLSVELERTPFKVVAGNRGAEVDAHVESLAGGKGARQVIFASVRATSLPSTASTMSAGEPGRGAFSVVSTTMVCLPGASLSCDLAM